MAKKHERLLPLFASSAEILYSTKSVEAIGRIICRLIYDYFLSDKKESECDISLDALEMSVYSFLKKEAVNYENYCISQAERRKNAKERKETEGNQSEPTGTDENQREVNINKNININKNKNINKNVNINNNNILSGKPDDAHGSNASKIEEILSYLNEKTGKKFSPKSEANKEVINARLKEGYEVEDFKQAIDNETGQWMGTDMEKYLRPSTLFSKQKFDGYVNDTFAPESKKEEKSELAKDMEFLAALHEKHRLQEEEEERQKQQPADFEVILSPEELPF